MVMGRCESGRRRDNAGDGSALLVVYLALVSSPLLSGDVVLMCVEELMTSGAVSLSAIKASLALVKARPAAVQVLLAPVLILLAAVLPGVDGTPGRGDLNIDDRLLTLTFPTGLHPLILSPEQASFTTPDTARHGRLTFAAGARDASP